MHKLHEFHECVNCVLLELNILGEPYEMSVGAYELRKLIEMVEMIAQIMSDKDCANYKSIDIRRKKKKLFELYKLRILYELYR